MTIPLKFLRMIFLCVAFMAALVFYEHVIVGQNNFMEIAPTLTLYNVLRSGIALLLGAALIHQLLADGRRFGAPIVPRLSAGDMAMASLTGCLAVGAAWLFVVDPQRFNILALEDDSVEWLSAILLFVASLFFVFCAAGLVRSGLSEGGWRPFFAACLAAGFAFVFFVVGMEEISWMQRVFAVETPEALFTLNDQHEFNFHNIATGAFELAYYCGAFAFLILLPLVGHIFRDRLPRGALRAFVPGLGVLAASIPLAAFNCGRWGIFPIQMTMMLTVIILLVLSDAALRADLVPAFLVFALGAVATVAIQELFLLRSASLVRLWDPTEYKEGFIAAGFALYAFQTWARLRAPSPGWVLQPAS